MSLFYRLTTDQQVLPTTWENACAGPQPSACWLIGSGPSLTALPCADISRSPIPKMAVNLAGVKLIRPNFWTAYDPSLRFHRSLYLDAGITKFLPRNRAMDLVPDSTFKVCECPQTYFFDRDPHRGYHDFMTPKAIGIVDWADTLVQAIDILYRLGFRKVHLAGCELYVRPSPEWISRAANLGVKYDDGEALASFARRCRERGMTEVELTEAGTGPLYHFDEAKPFEAALRTDEHYFRVVQSLRLCRQPLSTAGMQLISVTPRSRLNHFFEYRPVEAVLDQLRLDIGDPQREPTRGLYTQVIDRSQTSSALMRDVFPPRKPARRKPCNCSKRNPSTGSTSTTELIVEEENWEPIANAENVFSRHYQPPVEEG